MQSRDGRHRRGAPAAGSTTCLMSLVGDYKFFTALGENAASAAGAILSMVSFVDARYRATDFGLGSPLGIAVAELTIYTSPAADPDYDEANRDVYNLLSQFSQNTNHRHFCLSHLFTADDFASGVLGLAWVGSTSSGGICDGFGQMRTSLYGNTGLTTTINAGAAIPTLMVSLVFMHEVGWGAVVLKCAISSSLCHIYKSKTTQQQKNMHRLATTGAVSMMTWPVCRFRVDQQTIDSSCSPFLWMAQSQTTTSFRVVVLRSFPKW